MRHVFVPTVFAALLVAGCASSPLQYEGISTLLSTETRVDLSVGGVPVSTDVKISVGFFAVELDDNSTEIAWCLLVDSGVGSGALPVFDADACAERYGAFEFALKIQPAVPAESAVPAEPAEAPPSI